MWRDQDPRSYEGGRSRDDVERDDLNRGSRGGSDPREALSRDPRDVFSRGLALPRGSRRQRVTVRERTYELRGSEVRLLATVGAFRAVPQRDLEPNDARTGAGRDREIEHLRNSGLIETRPFGAGRSRTTLVTLTESGRDLLVSSVYDITYEIVKERTSRDDCKNGYILDGYPRTAVQAKQLEDLAASQKMEIQAIEVDVPREELMRRLTGRRSCPVCGEIYNIYSKPPKIEGRCDFHPEAGLVHRADDNEESVNTRLETYESSTKPLLDFYRVSDRLQRVDGTKSVEDIYKELDALV